MTLTDFLLARIAEDEADAREDDAVPTPEGCWSPERVLAECEAKRRIVEAHHEEDRWVIGVRQSDRLIAEGFDLPSVPTQFSAYAGPACLRALAAVYADHPDYREEWRP